MLQQGLAAMRCCFTTAQQCENEGQLFSVMFDASGDDALTVRLCEHHYHVVAGLFGTACKVRLRPVDSNVDNLS